MAKFSRKVNPPCGPSAVLTLVPSAETTPSLILAQPKAGIGLGASGR
jgi:hypothetical protein